MTEKRAMSLFGMVLFTVTFFICLVILGHRVPEEVIALTGDAKTHVQALRNATGVGLVVSLNAAAMSWAMWKKKDE